MASSNTSAPATPIARVPFRGLKRRQTVPPAFVYPSQLDKIAAAAAAATAAAAAPPAVASSVVETPNKRFASATANGTPNSTPIANHLSRPLSDATKKRLGAGRRSFGASAASSITLSPAIAVSVTTPSPSPSPSPPPQSPYSASPASVSAAASPSVSSISSAASISSPDSTPHRITPDMKAIIERKRQAAVAVRQKRERDSSSSSSSSAAAAASGDGDDGDRPLRAVTTPAPFKALRPVASSRRPEKINFMIEPSGTVSEQIDQIKRMINHLNATTKDQSAFEETKMAAKTKQLEELTEKWTVAAQDVLPELLKKGASDMVCTMPQLLQALKIDPSMVRYDLREESFLTAEQYNAKFDNPYSAAFSKPK